MKFDHYEQKYKTALQTLNKQRYLSKENKKLINDFLFLLLDDTDDYELSSATMSNHINYLIKFNSLFIQQFGEFTKKTFLDVNELEIYQLHKALITCDDYMKATKKKCGQTIRRFYELNEKSHLLTNSRGKQLFKVSKISQNDTKQKYIISENEIELLIQKASNLRNSVIIALMYDLYMRVNELHFLKFSQFDELMHLDEYVYSVRIIATKTENERNPIIYNHYDLVKKYLHQRKLELKDSYTNESYIFDLSLNSINRIIKKEIYKILGDKWKEKNASSHIFRRSKATNEFNSGTDLKIIQRDGGWKSLKTLDSYIKVEKTTPQKQLEELKTSQQLKSNRNVMNKVSDLTENNTKLLSELQLLKIDNQRKDLEYQTQITQQQKQIQELSNKMQLLFDELQNRELQQLTQHKQNTISLYYDTYTGSKLPDSKQKYYLSKSATAQKNYQICQELATIHDETQRIQHFNKFFKSLLKCSYNEFKPIFDDFYIDYLEELQTKKIISSYTPKLTKQSNENIQKLINH